MEGVEFDGGSKSPSPSPEKPNYSADPGSGDKRKAEEATNGRGTKKGQQHRAKQDPSLHLNKKGPNAAPSRDRSASVDPVGSAASTTERFIAMLESASESDAKIFDRFASAQEAQAKAQATQAKAALVREAGAAINAFVNAKEKGIELPAGLLKLLNGDEEPGGSS